VTYGRAGLNCRRAFARFSKDMVIRTVFLLDIPAGHLKGRPDDVLGEARVLSKTAGAGAAGLIDCLHRRV
jgi:hypothetical protein